MTNKPKLLLLDEEIATDIRDGVEDICITDIARCKNAERTDDLIRNWLRNRNTIEFLGIWEQLNNPDFKPIESDEFRSETGLSTCQKRAKLVLLISYFGGGHEQDTLIEQGAGHHPQILPRCTSLGGGPGAGGDRH